MSSFNTDIDRLTGYARRRVAHWFITFIALGVSLVALCAPANAMQCPGEWEGNMTEYHELVMEPPTDHERAEVYAAVARCGFRTKPSLVNHWDMLALVRLEERLSVPRSGRGILPAIWCIEASLKTEHKGGPILGDFREGRGYISQGPFQLSEQLAAGCGGSPDDRHDLLWAARCWVSHIHRVHPRVQASCGKRSWVVAEALIANPRKYAGRCDVASKHYRLLGK
jgi:hypothetical protein